MVKHAKTDGMLIRLQFMGLHCITTDEYDQLVKELEARSLVGDLTYGDRLLASLLYDASYRYNEIMAIRANRAKGK